MATQNPSIPLTLAPPTELKDADEDELATDEKRELRAHTQEMLIIPHADEDGYCTGTYDIHRPAKDPYTVNPRELDESPSVMMCGDMQYRRPSGGCKHIRRIQTMVEQDLLPDEDEDATEYLENLVDTYERLVEERDELTDQQARLRRQIRLKLEERSCSTTGTARLRLRKEHPERRPNSRRVRPGPSGGWKPVGTPRPERYCL
ncbi:hypothetical protein [Halorussus salinus]|uniref:hypothetical protein n=1 Tax=Halorussus salinus TaxID=1364935 RepID=UPI001091D9DA|nr:hypothetical protein [Halorussus salinus]